MKRLGILCTVVLVVLFSVASVVGCADEEEAPTPAPKTTPAPTTTPESTPTPTPAPEPEPEPTPEPRPTIEVYIYTNSEYGFSFGYPADWDIMEDFMETVVFVAGPRVLGGIYMVNITLATEQLTEEITSEDYAQVVELNTKRTVKDYNKVGEYDTTIGGQPSTVFTCTATVESDGKAITVKDAFAVFIKDNIGYIITYDVPEELHDEYADYFKLMIDSFEFE